MLFRLVGIILEYIIYQYGIDEILTEGLLVNEYFIKNIKYSVNYFLFMGEFVKLSLNRQYRFIKTKMQISSIGSNTTARGTL